MLLSRDREREQQPRRAAQRRNLQLSSGAATKKLPDAEAFKTQESRRSSAKSHVSPDGKILKSKTKVTRDGNKPPQPMLRGALLESPWDEKT